MARWTHIFGTIQVRMCESTNEASEYILKTVLKHLPEVWCELEPMKVIMSNTGRITGACTHDEFGNYRYNSDDMDEYQEYVLTVIGDVRHGWYQDVTKEFMKWLTRLAKRVNVSDVLVSIKQDFGEGDVLITNPNDCFSNMYEYSYEESKGNWCDYLRVKYDKRFRFPKKLLKYYFPEDFEICEKCGEEYIRGEEK